MHSIPHIGYPNLLEDNDKLKEMTSTKQRNREKIRITVPSLIALNTDIEFPKIKCISNDCMYVMI
jgi:hypothetical protein